MDNRINDAKRIIDESKDLFLERISTISEISAYKKYNTYEPDFAIFNPANKEFHQYLFYEKTLEWFIRDYLVNKTLAELFELFSKEVLYPNMEGKKYIRFSNEPIEDIIPFQFIFSDRGIGYRYTTFYSDENEMDGLLSDYDIKQIVVLNWSKKQKRVNQDDARISVKSIKEFFEEEFGKEIKDYFFETMTNAVERANEEIGFQTIPRLSLRYLSDFKAELLNEIKTIKFDTRVYQLLSDTGNYFNPKKNTMGKADCSKLNDNFLSKERYKALVGSEDFANSFVTAEYLYSIFKEGNSLDYTAVISGYLKSVEQLAHCIVKINLKNAKIEDGYWISANKFCFKRKKEDDDFADNMTRKKPTQKNIQQVRFVAENEKYFEIALGSLSYCLYDNKMYCVSDEGKKILHSTFQEYIKECRNEHLHKDNIIEYEEVEKIKNNTYLMLYYLLGGCSLLEDEKQNERLLGIRDDSFEKLYKALVRIPKSVRRFCIEIDEEQFYVFRLIEQEKIHYDEYGTICNTGICFVKDENYTDIEDEPSMKPDIELSEENMPEKMWYIKNNGEKVQIEW